MIHSLVYNEMNKQKKLEDIKIIHQKMFQYYRGVEEANISLLESVFHKEWQMRDNDIPVQSQINVEDKPTFLNRVKNHGPYKGYAAHRDFVNIGTAYDKIAFVRVNKDPSMNSTSFFLFKLNNDWQIIDKLWVTVKEQQLAIEDKFENNQHSIQQVLHDYFKAVRNANTTNLNDLLDKKWDLKYINADGTLHTESKSEFILDLENLTHYYYTKLMTIDIYHDTLAIVRIDNPKSLVSSFITLFNLEGKWKLASERRVYKFSR